MNTHDRPRTGWRGVRPGKGSCTCKTLDIHSGGEAGKAPDPAGFQMPGQGVAGNHKSDISWCGPGSGILSQTQSRPVSGGEGGHETPQNWVAMVPNGRGGSVAGAQRRQPTPPAR